MDLVGFCHSFQDREVDPVGFCDSFEDRVVDLVGFCDSSEDREVDLVDLCDSFEDHEVDLGPGDLGKLPPRGLEGNFWRLFQGSWASRNYPLRKIRVIREVDLVEEVGPAT